MFTREGNIMENKLERLERLAMPDELHKKECERLGIGLTEDYDILKAYLESIDKTKTSETLECLGNLERHFLNKWKQSYYLEEKPKELNDIITIKQALLKVQDQEKVLEIIKERQVDIYHLNKSSTVEEYNEVWDGAKYCLTKEEFDLLKEWLK